MMPLAIVPFNFHKAATDNSATAVGWIPMYNVLHAVLIQLGHHVLPTLHCIIVVVGIVLGALEMDDVSNLQQHKRLDGQRHDYGRWSMNPLI